MFKRKENGKDDMLIIGKQVKDDKEYLIPIKKLRDRLMIVDENQNIILNYVKQIISQEKSVFVVVENDELKNNMLNMMENNDKSIKIYRSKICFKLESSIISLTRLLMSFVEENEINNVEKFIASHLEAFKINQNIEFAQKTINEFIDNIENVKLHNKDDIEIRKIVVNGLTDLKKQFTENYVKKLDLFEDIKNRKNIMCISKNNKTSLFYYVLIGLLSSEEVCDLNAKPKDDYFIFLPLFSDENNYYFDHSMSVYLAQSRSLGKSIIVYTHKYDRKKAFLNANFNSLLLKISESNYLFIDDGIPNHLKINVISE